MTRALSPFDRCRRKACGATLLEALVAFVVLLLTVAAVVRAQGQLRLGADVSRQRSEAVRLGQADLELLRAYAVIGAASGSRAYAEIVSAAATVDGASGYVSNAAYLVTRAIQTGAADEARSAVVDVTWADRAGERHRVVLNTIVAAHDPAYSAALTLPPSGSPVRGAWGRSARIPLPARNLGDGRSAFKPFGSATVAWVFDNASGYVVASCSGIAAPRANADLLASDLVTCSSVRAVLLSGIIRFTSATPPDPGNARDLPAALAVVLTTRGGPYPSAPTCGSEPVKTVTYSGQGTLHVESVAIAATPASLGLANWTESGDHHVAYHCLVPLAADGTWSGRTTLAPNGWTLGSGAADSRVCRYAADLDGSGAIDSNIEHPADYVGVAASLSNQNFLVIAGNQSCPSAPAVRIAGAADDVFADLSTVTHQP